MLERQKKYHLRAIGSITASHYVAGRSVARPHAARNENPERTGPEEIETGSLKNIVGLENRVSVRSRGETTRSHVPRIAT
jgi:hypothetical protein